MNNALSDESKKLLIDWREAKFSIALVRSLTTEQQCALAGVMELLDADEAFRWF